MWRLAGNVADPEASGATRIMVLRRFTRQAVTNINTLLDKADRVYHQLMGHRPQLENLLCKVNEAAPEKPQVARGRQAAPGRPPGEGAVGGARPSWPNFPPSSSSPSFPPCQDDSGASGGLSSTSASVNRYILQLAQEYCGDCKNSFDELSKIIQVIRATPKIIQGGSLL